MKGEERPTFIQKKNKRNLKNHDKELNQEVQPVLFTKLESSSATRGVSWRCWQDSKNPAGPVESLVNGPAQCGGSGSGGFLRSLGRCKWSRG